MRRSLYVLDPDEREQLAIGLMADWPNELPGVLIGGYAVAAYGVPRYSVDVDIVAPAVSQDGWSRWLERRHLVRFQTHQSSSLTAPPVRVERWRHKELTVDLMTGGVRDRDSQTVIPEDWVLRNPQLRSLELLSGRVDPPLPVVRLAGLWALKILAGRPQDVTDLYGISTQPVGLGEVRELFEELSSPPLERKLARVSRLLLEPKTYVDSLSRLRRGSPELPQNRTRWELFVRMIEGVIPTKSRARSD